jgi:hypothetical protein
MDETEKGPGSPSTIQVSRRIGGDRQCHAIRYTTRAIDVTCRAWKRDYGSSSRAWGQLLAEYRATCSFCLGNGSLLEDFSYLGVAE